jgi:hypothetical protein
VKATDEQSVIVRKTATHEKVWVFTTYETRGGREREVSWDVQRLDDSGTPQWRLVVTTTDHYVATDTFARLVQLEEARL